MENEFRCREVRLTRWVSGCAEAGGSQRREGWVLLSIMEVLDGRYGIQLLPRLLLCRRHGGPAERGAEVADPGGSAMRVALLLANMDPGPDLAEINDRWRSPRVGELRRAGELSDWTADAAAAAANGRDARGRW